MWKKINTGYLNFLLPLFKLLLLLLKGQRVQLCVGLGRLVGFAKYLRVGSSLRIHTHQCLSRINATRIVHNTILHDVLRKEETVVGAAARSFTRRLFGDLGQVRILQLCLAFLRVAGHVGAVHRQRQRVVNLSHRRKVRYIALALGGFVSRQKSTFLGKGRIIQHPHSARGQGAENLVGGWVPLDHNRRCTSCHCDTQAWCRAGTSYFKEVEP
mmetsp:Transcript_52058/g.90881  ORF Transcript_52058/g.90881 Transcript_52058/m.90881 type:complete len:213 (-) Transcript_52058:1032-1670(-)